MMTDLEWRYNSKAAVMYQKECVDNSRGREIYNVVWVLISQQCLNFYALCDINTFNMLLVTTEEILKIIRDRM